MLANKTLDAINAAIEAKQEREHRNHLGASLIGNKCRRQIWYKWRWAKLETLCGQMLRLFDRGHKEEDRFLEYLELIGCEYWPLDPNTKKQFRFSEHNGHFGGSSDGIGLGGIPEIPPGEYWLGEFKTHNQKSFNSLVKNGLHGDKPTHFDQMQIYMKKLGLSWGLYMAVNKNTDDLYIEVVRCNPTDGDGLERKAGEIIGALTAPRRVSEKSNYYECNYCFLFDICHGQELPEKNCRTCEFSEPVEGAQWRCNKYNYVLSLEEQANGCLSYNLKPGFKS